MEPSSPAVVVFVYSARRFIRFQRWATGRQLPRLAISTTLGWQPDCSGGPATGTIYPTAARKPFCRWLVDRMVVVNGGITISWVVPRAERPLRGRWQSQSGGTAIDSGSTTAASAFQEPCRERHGGFQWRLGAGHLRRNVDGTIVSAAGTAGLTGGLLAEPSS